MIIANKKNSAFELTFPMVDSTTPASFKTGLSPVDTAYYKDGAGAWTPLAITDTAAEIGTTGIYEISLTAAEMNHDWVNIKFTAAGAADTLITFKMFTNNIDDVDTIVDAIKAKTDNLPAAPADDTSIDSQLAAIAGYIDTEVAAIKAKTDLIPADITTQLDTNLPAIKTKTDLIGASVALETGGNVVAIKAKTDTLPANPADDTSIDSQLAAIAGYIDTEVATIKAKTDLIPADITAQLDTNIPAIKAKTDLIGASVALESGGNVAAIKAKTDNLPAAPADDTSIDSQLAAIAGYIDTEVAAIKAKTDLIPADITTQLDTNVPAIKAKTDLIGASVALETGGNAAAIKTVTDKLGTAVELDGAVYRFTINALEMAPSGGASVGAIADAVWDETAAEHVAAGTTGKKLNDISGGAPVNIQHDSTHIVRN